MKAGTIVAMLLVLALVIPAISGCAGEGPSGEEIVVCTISGLTGGTAGTHLMCDAGWKDYIRYVNEVKGGFKGKNGTVMLKNINSLNAYVIGQVKNPGAFAITMETRVMHLLAMAKGLTPFAAERDIHILRNKNGKVEKIPFDYKQVLKGENLEQDVLLQRGDILVVP